MKKYKHTSAILLAFAISMNSQAKPLKKFQCSDKDILFQITLHDVSAGMAMDYPDVVAYAEYTTKHSYVTQFSFLSCKDFSYANQNFTCWNEKKASDKFILFRKNGNNISLQMGNSKNQIVTYSCHEEEL